MENKQKANGINLGSLGSSQEFTDELCDSFDVEPIDKIQKTPSNKSLTGGVRRSITMGNDFTMNNKLK